MKEKIVDLMREKFGIFTNAKTRKLTITAKDNLFSAYRKLALYLYANHEMTSAEEIQMVKHKISSHFDKEERENNYSELTKVDISVMSSELAKNIKYECKKSKNAENDTWKNHIYMIENADKAEKVFVVLSPEGVFKTNALKYSYYRKDYFTHSKETLMLVNMPLTYGYSVIQKDFYNTYAKEDCLNEFFKTSLSDDIFSQTFTKGKFAKYYPVLPNVVKRAKNARCVKVEDCTEVEKYDDDVLGKLPENSFIMNAENGFYVPCKTYFGTKYNISILMDVTLPGDKGNYYINQRTLLKLLERNLGISILRNYLIKTQNIFMQFDHDMEMSESLSHARFFEEKKNIKQETKRVMTIFENMLNNKFCHVEIDNDVELDKLGHIKDELKETTDILPNSNDGKKAILRFRKLRNHRALGIFTPVNNTVAVDFRSDENGMIEKGIGKKNIGLQSLIHEYGHFLDYNMLCDSAALSLSSDFDNILFQTQAELRANSKRLALMGEKIEYLCLPSEIFARAFEVYVYDCGLDNSFTKDSEQLNLETLNLRYSCFNRNIRLLIDVYFDKKFPTLRRDIAKYVKRHTEDDDLSKVSESSESSYTVESKKISKPKIYKHVAQLSLF